MHLVIGLFALFVLVSAKSFIVNSVCFDRVFKSRVRMEYQTHFRVIFRNIIAEALDKFTEYIKEVVIVVTPRAA